MISDNPYPTAYLPLHPFILPKGISLAKAKRSAVVPRRNFVQLMAHFIWTGAGACLPNCLLPPLLLFLEHFLHSLSRHLFPPLKVVQISLFLARAQIGERNFRGGDCQKLLGQNSRSEESNARIVPR